MSTVSDAHGQAEAAPSRVTGGAAAQGWLANQWPKAAIGFGFVLTVVWVTLLGWGLIHILSLL
jgi:hypothetical protein